MFNHAVLAPSPIPFARRGPAGLLVHLPTEAPGPHAHASQAFGPQTPQQRAALLCCDAPRVHNTTQDLAVQARPLTDCISALTAAVTQQAALSAAATLANCPAANRKPEASKPAASARTVSSGNGELLESRTHQRRRRPRGSSASAERRDGASARCGRTSADIEPDTLARRLWEIAPDVAANWHCGRGLGSAANESATPPAQTMASPLRGPTHAARSKVCPLALQGLYRGDDLLHVPVAGPLCFVCAAQGADFALAAEGVDATPRVMLRYDAGAQLHVKAPRQLHLASQVLRLTSSSQHSQVPLTGSRRHALRRRRTAVRFSSGTQSR